MQVSLCDKYGFDKITRQRRLAVFDLDDDNSSTSELLHRVVITENKRKLVEDFYEFLLDQPEMALYINDTEQLPHLKNTHLHYLETFGKNYAQQQYFERRLEVGLAHERIGLPLSLYLAAYRILQDLLISAIPDTLTVTQQKSLVQFILKISALDMSLATDMYHTVQVENLTSSIVHLRREEQRMASRIKLDSLTGAASREYLMDVLGHELSEASRRNRPTCIAMLDLDHFKNINDQYGHLVGDEILKGVVGRCRSNMRQLDVLGRYGGEEFILVFPNTDLDVAADIMQRIRQHIASQPVHIDDLSIPVTISAGVTHTQKNDTIDSLIERADKLLYQAKNSGRNRIEF